MTAPDAKMPPPDTIPREEFYAQDERRRHSHVLSYGSAWKQPPWTDESHVLELMWFGATHEIVAYFITYDWSRLGPGRLARDAASAAVQEIAVESGAGIGRMLADTDLATSDIHVRVLGVVRSDLECHELLWDWRWMQHHRDGFEHVRQRIDEHVRRD